MPMRIASWADFPLEWCGLLLRPFLDEEERQALLCLNKDWQSWEIFGDCPLAVPSQRWWCCLHGFGKLNLNLQVNHTTLLIYFIMHKVWDFLLPWELAALADEVPAFVAYTQLWCSMMFVSISSLWEPLSSFTGLQHHQAWQMAVALICFDFNFGDLICWLEGEYTNAHQDWSAMCNIMNVVHNIPLLVGYPAVEFDRAFCICTKGVPLAGTYECSFASVQQRNLYHNHPGMTRALKEVHNKLAKEEAQCFHIAFPCFIWQFLPGLHIAPLVWVLHKGKG